MSQIKKYPLDPADRFKANLDQINNVKFSAFTHYHAKPVEVDGRIVLEVNSENAFTQAVGYVKFVLKDHFTVMYRGQSQLYKTLKPSLYRRSTSDGSIQKQSKKINDLLGGLAHLNLMNRSTPDYAREAVLQHYGVHTRWLDLVDNHWIALWFSAHRFVATKDGLHVHIEKRNPKEEEDPYGYILLMATPKFWINQSTPGLYRDSDSQLIDLRSSAPSVYLRPHAQHAYLMKRNTINTVDDSDYINRVAGIIRIPLELINDWLGVGGLISSKNLFPPPYYDSGYQLMLENNLKYTDNLGVIQYIFPTV